MPEARALGDVSRVVQAAVHGALAGVRVEHVFAETAMSKKRQPWKP